jgi:hypothetical protein
MRRRLWIILLAVPLGLLLVDTLYWQVMVRRLADGFTAWETEQRAAGWSITHEPLKHGGWPLAARVIVPAISVTGGSQQIPGGVSWSAERLVLGIGLLRPDLLELAGEGNERLRLARSAELPFTADELHVVLPLGTGRLPESADISAVNLRTTSAAGADFSVGSLVSHMTFHPAARSGERALGFALGADAIDLPPNVVRLFGPRIAKLQVDGALNGPPLTGRTPTEYATGWRDGGGSLEVHHLAVLWGPLDLSASATIALDEQLQPMGAGSARLVGYAEALDALAAHAAISRSAATAAKAVLSLMANNPDDGRPPDVDVPLTLQYRTLSMRQVPLARLPEIDWP